MRHLTRGSLNGLLKSSKIIFSIIIIFPHFDCLLVSLWFPSCPLLLSLSFRTFRLFFVLFLGIDRVVVARCSRSHIIADVYFIISSHRSDDVIQLRCFLFLIRTQMSVREGSFSCSSAHGPRGSGFAVEFSHNAAPHQFLEPTSIFVVSLTAQGTIHPFQLLDVFSSVHIIPNSTLRSPVM